MLGKEAIAPDFNRMTGLPVSLLEHSAGDIELQLVGFETKDSFVVRATQRQRKLIVEFVPGTFAASLVEAMGDVDEQGVALWEIQSSALTAGGCTLAMTVNGSPVDPLKPQTWPLGWRFLSVTLTRNLVALDREDLDYGLRSATFWVASFGALLAALLPIEAVDPPEGEVEGDVKMQTHRKYERSPRNRAAAIAIHGYDCHGCDVNLGRIYGELGHDFIEIHHVKPLSELDGPMIVDPRTDLAPLCPTCHGIVHRRRPAYSIAELRAAMGRGSR